MKPSLDAGKRKEEMMTTQAIQPLSKPHIRPVALCVFRRNRSILVTKGYDPHKGEVFYRPLGGGVEFGEYSWETIRREIREELGEEIHNLNFIGPAENLFEYNGRVAHEIVFIFEAEFTNRKIYKKDSLSMTREGKPFHVSWMPLSDFRKGKATLYPEGLLEMLS